MAKPPSPTGQVSQAEANYRPAENPLQSCGKCGTFMAPDKCSKVQGKISETGLCDLFQEVVGPDEETLMKAMF